MDYKEAWKAIKKTLQIGLLVKESGLIDTKDGGAEKLARAIIETMEECEKAIGEESK